MNYQVNHIPLDGNLVWNPEMFVMHFIGHLLKPNTIRKKEENLEKCVLELIDVTKNLPKTTVIYLQQVSKMYRKIMLSMSKIYFCTFNQISKFKYFFIKIYFILDRV